MATDKMIFVAEKYYAVCEKSGTVMLPYQVVQELGLKTGDNLEFEAVVLAEEDGEFKGFTLKKKDS